MWKGPQAMSHRGPKKGQSCFSAPQWAFREAFHTLQWASILQQGQQHVRPSAPGGLSCCAGCPTPTDSLSLPSDSICHPDASPARGHGSKRWCFAFSTSRSFGSPGLKVKSWKCWPAPVPGYAFESTSCLCCVTPWQARSVVFWARGLDREGPDLRWHRGFHSGSGTVLCTWPLYTEDRNPNFSITKSQGTFTACHLTFLSFRLKHKGMTSSLRGDNNKKLSDAEIPMIFHHITQ